MPKLAVIGHPVAHSRSPQMQTAALKAMGLWPEWDYGWLDLSPEEFSEGVRALADDGDWRGVNITIPHKQAALGLADWASPEVEQIGAANTLLFSERGIKAYNTDAIGLLASLPGSPRARRALVLGAGGAARAAIWALAKAGAVVDVDPEFAAEQERGVRVREVDTWNRTPARAAEVYEDFRQFMDIGGAPTESPDIGRYGIIVNTTSVGLRGEDPLAELAPLAKGDFDPEQVVVDMVYGEQPSRLLAAAEAAGATPVDGLEILVQQGARSLAIWLEKEKLPEAVIERMREAARGESGEC